MGRNKHKKGDKIVFIDEKESRDLHTPELYSICTVVMEFDASPIDSEIDRTIAISESPRIVYRPDQFISLIEFRKQKIEKCLKRVTK